jgi:hypothetical protein
MKVSFIFGQYCGENEPMQRPLTHPKLQEECAKVLEEGRLSDRGDSDKGMGIIVFQSFF